jgi:hypothetical protein
MPRTCTICNHSDRESIERALLAGESFRNIASRFGTSTAALVRHRDDHLTQSLVKSHEAEQVARADSLLDDVRTAGERAETMYAAAEDILARAREVKDLRTALQAIRAAVDVMREGRGYLELRGRITGELNKEQDAIPPIASIGEIRVLMMPKAPGVPAREGGGTVDPEDMIRAHLLARRNGYYPNP